VSTIRNLAVMVILAVAGAAASAGSTGVDEATELARWKAQRLASLTGETGWLTLVGLYWFHEGANSFGRARSNAIALDEPQLDARAGTFIVSGRALRFEPGRSSCVHVGDKPALAQELLSDSAEEPTLLSCGSLQFWAIERAGKFGLRVRDTASRARREFRGLEYFPDDASWLVDARFEAYEPLRHVPIVNVLGMEIDMESPGAVVFDRDGREWRLDALLEEPGADKLFIMFADGTSGHETYGAGRFMYVPLPAGGHVPVDFNKAYSPPCAFTSYATCPLPPAQNRIALRVTAGELRYAGSVH
jgi:uncharacterized protein (DUF1684 family)